MSGFSNAMGLIPQAAVTEGQEANVVTDYILKVTMTKITTKSCRHLVGSRTLMHMFSPQILGLEICADVMVGDEMLRGISGGQRKRVTTG